MSAGAEAGAVLGAGLIILPISPLDGFRIPVLEQVQHHDDVRLLDDLGGHREALATTEVFVGIQSAGF